MSGKPAYAGQLHHQDLTVEIGVDKLLDPAFLPDGEPAAWKLFFNIHAAECLDEMRHDGCGHMINEEFIDLIGTIKSRKQRITQGSESLIDHAEARRKIEIANPADTGIVRTGVQRTPRNVEV